MKTYPVYYAHKSSKKLKVERLNRLLAKPLAFTFLSFVLCAIATNDLLAEQQAQSDSKALVAMMNAQPEVLSPPKVR